MSDLEDAVKLVLEAGHSTGHADSCKELVEEMLDNLRELEKELDLYKKTVEINGWPDISETHVVTHKEIDEAWAFIVDPPGFLNDDVKDAVELALGALRIKRCGGCEECDGDGWYIP